jgi:outer membrane protein assembly factor BamB
MHHPRHAYIVGVNRNAQREPGITPGIAPSRWIPDRCDPGLTIARRTAAMTSRIVLLVALVAGCDGDGSGARPDGGSPNDECSRCGGLQRGSPWPSEGHDVRNQRRSTFAGPEQPAILWRSEVASSTDRDAVVVAKDGTIYASGYGGLVVLRPDGSEIARDVTSLGGLYASIAEDGRVYVVDDFSDRVESLDPATQERSLLVEYWANGNAALWPIVAADQRIYLGGIYGHAMSSSGDPLWSVSPTGDVQTGARCEHAPALAVDGTLRFACNEVLRGVDHEGQIQWSAPAVASLDSSAVLDEDGTTYLCGNSLIAIDSTGAERFTSGSCLSGTSPAIGEDGTIYVAGYSELMALDKSGSERFRFPYYQNNGSSPAIDSDGTIYVAADIASDSGAYLIAIHPDGTEKWKLPIGTNGGSPSIGLDHRVYVIATDTDRVHKLVAVGSP